MLKNATIVFDLDGTLVDTAPDLTNTLNHVLTSRGYEAITPDRVREAVGRGARVMIEHALAVAGADGDVEGMLAEFLAHYGTHIAVESRPFPGAVAALERLRAAGARLAVCTNKSERLTHLLPRALEIDHYFAAVAGRDTHGVSKPDPRHLVAAIEGAGGDPGRAIMVGDSIVDIQAAQGARVPSILVSFGYCPPPPEGPRPDAVIDHFDMLEERALPLLKRLTAKARAPS